MRKRAVVDALTAQHCQLARQGSEHEIWRCPCGKHQTSVPRHQTVTAGVCASIVRHLPCLPKGWLQ